ncbi:hypothetical protein LDENG_00212360 [Lucifuga dentata]|nr:hypothetical protein LDENG_00212360 [Lucifuga dentata]
MAVPQLLLETLENLDNDEFNTFKWYLSYAVLESCRPIARCHLESPARHDAVTKMIDSYGEKSAVEVTAEILKKINNNNAAQMLKKAYAEGTTAEQKPILTASTSLSALQQPGTTISAQDRSVYQYQVIKNAGTTAALGVVG